MSYFDEQLAKRRATATAEARSRPSRGTSQRAKVDATGAFVYGLADTVTFGYLDEAGAFLDSVVLGKNYETALADNRALMGGVQEDHGTAFTVGQVAGAFVPFGALSRANSVRGMVATGAASGGLYGSGSADGDLMDRLKGAAAGAALGGAAGYTLGGVIIPAAKWGGKKAVGLLRHGRDPRLTTEHLPAPKVPQGIKEADELASPATAPVSAPKPRTNVLTGEADDVLEDGALLSMRELLGDPAAARKALDARLGKLSAIEAQRIAQRLEDAELNGDVIDDPHFRSLLGIDLSDTNIDTDTAMLAVELLEEASEKIIAKAGAGSRTIASLDHEFRASIDEGKIMGGLEEALKRTSRGVIDTRVAQHAMMLAGVQFVRAKDRLLPLIQQGREGAREELVEVLSKSAHLMAMSRGIVGNAGRALRYLQEGGKLSLTDIPDDVMHIESLDTIRKRVDGALKHFGDEDLRDLLGRLRTASDIDRVEDILLDAEKAKDFSGWRRSMNSVSMFLRSNALTPATGLFNTISFVAHDFFRNDLAKAWAARNFAKLGKSDDALALRFELEVGRRVYWHSHREGLQALLNRARWEFWGDVEKVAAVGWGKGAVAQAARGKRQAMLNSGFQKPVLREFVAQPRANVTDAVGFNERLSELRSGGGAFGNVVYHLERAKAVAANTVDALGGASMKLFTGAVDDWGREFVKVKETYALSARFAIREALELSLPQAEMLSYAQRRAIELAEMPPAEILRQVEARLLRGEELGDDLTFLTRREREVDLEADRTLFNDGPQTSGGKVSAQFAGLIDKAAGLGQVEGVLLPYIRTPIRLFERGLVSYTPWGAASKEVADILKRGGVEAEIEKARMEVGTMGIKLGMLLGLSGGLTLTNGGWKNSANLDAGPPNRINFPGGGYVEVGRLDPFSLTLALGGFVGQALKEGWQEGNSYDVDAGLHASIQIAYLSVRDSVLEKSYLKGLKELMGVMLASDGDNAATGLERILQNAFTRAIPVSGISRQINETIRDNAPEAVGWTDQILRSIPGGGLFLSDRIDALGDPVDGREMGISAGSSETTPVKEQLRDLGIDIVDLRRVDPTGFRLSSSELSELRRIRGKEATNRAGLTMEEALQELFQDPYFQELPTKGQKREMVLELMAEFNEPARALLEERDPQYLSNREAYRSLHDYLSNGFTRPAAEQAAHDDARANGLPTPDL